MPVDTGRLGMPKLDTVHCCQWRALLRLLPEQSVDLLLTDMPYNSTAVSWDKYVVPLDAFWRHVKRVMKPRGAVVLTGSQPFTSKLVMSNEAWFRYEWVWEKSRPTDFVNANNKPMNRHENILVFSAGNTANGSRRKMFYYPQGLINRVMNESRSSRGYVGERPKQYDSYVSLLGNYPTTVLQIPSPTLTQHQTQKPVALFEYLIRTYTNPGAIVVDPFVGSGTTAVAAANTGRHFIVGDISQEYVDIARWRLSKDFGAQKPGKGAAPLTDLPLMAWANSEQDTQHD